MSIGGLSGSTSGKVTGSSGKRVSGLASGMDTDELVRGMTEGTRSKIAQALQKKQTLQWKQGNYRDISSSLIDFTSKYCDPLSSTNLFSSKFFGRGLITSMGANSRFVNATGNASTADRLRILGIKQMASNANFTTAADERNVLKTDDIFMNQSKSVSNLAGKQLGIEYGGKLYSVTLDKDGDYSTIEKAAETINKTLAKYTLPSGAKLGDKVIFGPVTGSGATNFTISGAPGDTNSVAFGKSDPLVHDTLGFTDGQAISNGGTAGAAAGPLTHNESFAERVGGKYMSFNYNGITKTINLPPKEVIEGYPPGQQEAELAKHLQGEMDKLYGTGRIEVNAGPVSGGGTNQSFQLSFELKNLSTGGPDKTSTLRLMDAEEGLVGNGGDMGLRYGDTNKLNVVSKLEDSGLANISTALSNPAYFDADGKMLLTVNGVKIEGLTKDSSISDIISKINNTKEAKVSVSYMNSSGSFAVTSTESGAAGKVDFSGFSDVLFGDNNNGNTAAYTPVAGQDASLLVQYEGSAAFEIERPSNTFTLDGLTLELKNVFGYTPGTPGPPPTPPALIPDTEPITFSATCDVDKITAAVKDMVEDYNDMVEKVNKMVGTKHDRDYAPLTDEQKESMTDKEIENWNLKASEGLLFADNNVRGLADELRFVLRNNYISAKDMKDRLGIGTSENWKDNGKIIFEEEKFKNALKADPDEVQKVFSTPIVDAADAEKGNGGIMAKLDRVIDKYAKVDGAPKGILIDIAGHPASPLSMLQNSILRQIEDIDKQVKELKRKLLIEEDRHYAKFTRLEQLVNQMNSQSGWLNQQGAQ